MPYATIPIPVLGELQCDEPQITPPASAMTSAARAAGRKRRASTGDDPKVASNRVLRSGGADRGGERLDDAPGRPPRRRVERSGERAPELRPRHRAEPFAESVALAHVGLQVDARQVAGRGDALGASSAATTASRPSFRR